MTITSADVLQFFLDEAAVNAIATRDYYLIQGPPGTGKSYVISVIASVQVDIQRR